MNLSGCRSWNWYLYISVVTKDSPCWGLSLEPDTREFHTTSRSCLWLFWQIQNLWPTDLVHTILSSELYVFFCSITIKMKTCWVPEYTHADLWVGFLASSLCRWGLKSEGTQRWALSELHKILHDVHWQKQIQFIRCDRNTWTGVSFE